MIAVDHGKLHFCRELKLDGLNGVSVTIAEGRIRLSADLAQDGLRAMLARLSRMADAIEGRGETVLEISVPIAPA